MLNRSLQNKKIIIALAMCLLVSCAFMGENNDAEVQALKEQVSLLATQNSILAEQADASEAISEGISAPTPPQETANEIALSSPTPESLPTAPVEAGVPIIYNGWSIMVSKELNINSYEDIWGIDIYVRNLGETSRIFRFTNSAITATDDLGNAFEPSTLCPYMSCSSCEEYYYQVKNLEIGGLDSTVISSGTSGNGCMYEDGIGLFKGPISLGAKQLIIHFSDFGPFNNVDVYINL